MRRQYPERTFPAFVAGVVVVFAVAVAGIAVPACSGPRGVDGARDDVGVAHFLLSEVPADVRCLSVVAEGTRSVSKWFPVAAGSAVTLEMAGLALGPTTFEGAAFSTGCEGGASMDPSWVADPVAAVLEKGVVAQVVLVMHRNGRASIGVDFQDDGVAGAGQGGGGTGGASGAGDAAASGGASESGGAPGTGGNVGGSTAGHSGSGGSPTEVDAGVDAVTVDGPTGDGPVLDAAVETGLTRDGAQGGSDWCAPASPNDVWTRGSFSADSIFAFSPTDLWITQGGQILHGDGSTWSMVLDTGQSLGSIWASRPDDIWVGGSYPLHGDGVAFQPVTFPDGPWYFGVTFIGLSPTDVWAAQAFVSPHKIAHWDGSTWTARTLPPPAIGSLEVDGLWPVATNDVWAVGRVRAGASTLFRWDGRMWQAWPANAIPVANYYSFWGTSASDVWLIGDRGIVHFDGTDWSLVDPTVFSMNGGRVLWGSCRNDVWASLPSTTLGYHPQLAHFDGTKWSKQTIDSGTGSPGEITGSGPDQLWVLGRVQKERHPGSSEAVCGNVRIDPGEQCDPPDGVTCAVNCLRLPGCGDGVVGAGEQCDPPDNYTCGATCQILPLCGNYRIDPGEQCDPPWAGSINPCSDRCQIPTCGNGRIDPGEDCEPPSRSWSPGRGSPLYCGPDCKSRNACDECHSQCGTDPICICGTCSVGPYNPCLACPLK